MNNEEIRTSTRALLARMTVLELKGEDASPNREMKEEFWSILAAAVKLLREETQENNWAQSLEDEKSWLYSSTPSIWMRDGKQKMRLTRGIISNIEMKARIEGLHLRAKTSRGITMQVENTLGVMKEVSKVSGEVYKQARLHSTARDSGTRRTMLLAFGVSLMSLSAMLATSYKFGEKAPKTVDCPQAVDMIVQPLVVPERISAAWVWLNADIGLWVWLLGIVGGGIALGFTAGFAISSLISLLKAKGTEKP